MYVTEVKSASQRLKGGEESVSSICIVTLGHEYMQVDLSHQTWIHLH